jgi:leucyl aminopeptidase (aminopeptidase T)
MKFAANILKNSMGLKKNESLVIIYDKNKKYIAQSFLDAGKNIAKETNFISMPVAKANGEEPPKRIAEAIKQGDVALLITTKSLSHTIARRNASKSGCRIASMPGITEGMALRTLSADYSDIKKQCNNASKKITGKKVELITKKGTLFTTYTNRLFQDTGIYKKKGDFGNLPAGEVGFAPKEGKSNGVIIIDKSMAGIGLLKDPIKLIVKNGFVTEIQGKEEAKKLRALLKKFNNKKVYNIAEFAIGLNKKAKITGNVLEDEKVYNTVHIAIGDNTSYPGGKTPAPTHLDGVISKPKIYIDKKLIKIN